MASSEPETIYKNEKLNDQLKGYASLAEPDRKERSDLYEKFEKFLTKTHWPGGETDRPSIPLCWYIADAQRSKVMDRPVTLKIVPEEECDYPLQNEAGELSESVQRFKALIDANAQQLGIDPANPATRKTDNEYYAMLANALLQRELDQVKLSDKLFDACGVAAWYSQTWISVWRDEQRTLRGEHANGLDIIHPKRVLKDPHATCYDDNRFTCYEVDRTKSEMKARFGKIADELKPGLDSGKQDVKADDSRALITLECWLVKDEGVEGTEEDEEIPEVPKYAYGWKIVYRAQDKILEAPKDAGRFPLAWLPWYAIPGKMDALGVMDLFRTQNFQIDQSMHYALENAKTTGQNYYFVDKAAFQGKENQLSNIPGKFVDLDTPMGGTTAQSIVAVQGLDVSGSHYLNIDKHRELMDTVSGAQDLKVGESLPRDASGEFMKEVKGESAMRLAQIRDHQVVRVAKEIARVLLELAMEQTTPITLKLDDEQGQQITFVPADLKLEDAEIEAKIDIVADGSANEPHNPIDRDNYINKIITELMALPPPLAKLRINLAEWSRKDEIRKAMEEFWASQTGTPNPEEAKANGQIAKDFSQGIQNLSDGLVTAGQLGLAVDALLAGLPITLNLAKGQPVDLSGIIELRAQLDTVPPPMAGPVAPTQSDPGAVVQ